MSNELPEYTPLKLIVQAQNEASIGLVYKPSKSSDPHMIYKIILKNIYQIENPTRDGIKERIFADHPFLQRTKEMEQGVRQYFLKLDRRRIKKDIHGKGRQDKQKLAFIVEKQQTNDGLDTHENKEGIAAKIPTTKNK